MTLVCLRNEILLYKRWTWEQQREMKRHGWGKKNYVGRGRGWKRSCSHVASGASSLWFMQLSEPTTNNRLLFSSLPKSPLIFFLKSPSCFVVVRSHVCTWIIWFRSTLTLSWHGISFSLFLPSPNSCWLGHGSGGECNKEIYSVTITSLHLKYFTLVMLWVPCVMLSFLFFAKSCWHKEGRWRSRQQKEFVLVQPQVCNCTIWQVVTCTLIIMWIPLLRLYSPSTPLLLDFYFIFNFVVVVIFMARMWKGMQQMERRCRVVGNKPYE